MAEVRGSTGSPTVRRRELGATLRTLRLDRGFTVDQVAEHLECSPSKVSRMETGRRGATPGDVLTAGLGLLFVTASAMLAMTLAGWTPPALVAVLLMAVALSFGLSMPNIMNATMQPLPDIAGVVGAAAGSIQMTAGAIASSLVAIFFDGRSALSMTAVMAASSLLALLLYLLLARPAHRSGAHEPRASAALRAARPIADVSKSRS